MRKRDAEHLAARFLRDHYPGYAGCYLNVALEHDGLRTKSWSFGVGPDEEDPDYEAHGEPAVGYVHASGYVEGLYGANR